jgi:Ca2+-binding EF-hand superfamily protein
VDKEQKGIVYKEDFVKSLKSMNFCLNYPITDNQIDSIFHFFDSKNDGFVNYKSFIDTFEIKSF